MINRGFLLISLSAVIIRDWLLWGDPETPSTVRAVRNCQFGNAFREAPQLQSQLPTKPTSLIPNILHAVEIFRRTSRLWRDFDAVDLSRYSATSPHWRIIQPEGRGSYLPRFVGILHLNDRTNLPSEPSSLNRFLANID
jgi:hypothetical protein